jgi:hypothetical protein
MFAYFHRHRLIVPIAPALGGAAGLAFALAVATLPQALLDRAVSASHLPAVLGAAAPPLGATARALLVLGGGGGLALLTGIGLWLLLGGRMMAIGQAPIAATDESVPVLRRADAHPDAPARRPVFAHRDLGAPMIEVRAEPEAPPAEIALPEDLHQPLSAYDPGAIPDVPREPVRAVASLVPVNRPQLIDPEDRFETFDPAPFAAEREPTATLHALLDRLEAGVRRKDRTPRPRSGSGAGSDLDTALGALRRLASDAA